MKGSNKSKPTKPIAQKAITMAKKAMSLIPKREVKYMDNIPSYFSNPNATPVVYLLSGIGQGLAYAGRVGNSVKGLSLTARLLLQQSTLATASAIRLIFFVDKENQGTLPLATDVLENTGNSVVSPYNHNNTDRFRILKDKTYVINNYGLNEIKDSIYCRLSHNIKFSGAAGSTYNEGNVFVLVVSDTIANNPSFNMYTRIRYVDND